MPAEPVVVEAAAPGSFLRRPDTGADASSRPRWLGGVIGVVLLLLAWQVLAAFVVSGRVLPTPLGVARQMVRDFSFYGPHVRTTVSEAAKGWVWGNVLAVALAIAFVVIPGVEQALLRVAIATYCMPIIAIGPILQIVFNGDTPKVALAALSVFFTTLIGTVVGLRSADRSSLELIRAYGGGRFKQLVKVRLRAALPSFFAALCIAAPAAMLGAIIGEYLGGESGLGVAMINSQQAFEVERTWGLAFVATGLAGIGYAATAIIGRLATPWTRTGGGDGQGT